MKRTYQFLTSSTKYDDAIKWYEDFKTENHLDTIVIYDKSENVNFVKEFKKRFEGKPQLSKRILGKYTFMEVDMLPEFVLPFLKPADNALGVEPGGRRLVQVPTPVDFKLTDCLATRLFSIYHENTGKPETVAFAISVGSVLLTIGIQTALSTYGKKAVSMFIKHRKPVDMQEWETYIDQMDVEKELKELDRVLTFLTDLLIVKADPDIKLQMNLTFSK